MLFLSGFGEDASPTFAIASVPPVQLPDSVATSSGNLVPRPFQPRDVRFRPGDSVTSIPVGPDILPTAKPTDIVGLIPEAAPGAKPHVAGCKCGGARKPQWWPVGLPAPAGPVGWMAVGAGVFIVINVVFGR